MPAQTETSGVDSGWIVSRLARPVPMRTSFVELRNSKLLKQPLRLSGEYQRPRADTLVRQVHAPYRETTTIVTSTGGAGQATIVRDGKSRTVSLARVPELAVLYANFSALLAGDQTVLNRYYRITTAGSRERWILTLAPKDAALAAKVRRIVLYGRGAELRCIETEQAGTGQTQRTLLASAALASDGQALEALPALCRGEV